MLKGPEPTIARAKTLRSAMSLPEVLLWRALRTRPSGFKFRRQQPAGPYVADFYCHEARLVIEVDGEAHGCGDRPILDDARDRWFEDRGFKVMRVTARDLLADANAAAQGIAAAVGMPLHQPPAGPHPHAVHGVDPAGAP